MDGIDYVILQNLTLNYKLILVDTLNEMFVTNDCPDKWKESYINFIEKSDGKNVRPIYLSSCICKILETMIKNKLQWWVERMLPIVNPDFAKGNVQTII